MNLSTTDDPQTVTPAGLAALLELTQELEGRLRTWSVRLAIAGDDVTADLVDAVATFSAFVANEPR